ncbi:hypothetical protein XACJJ10_1090035 [Xanthomonas citri pv. citri]|nr:hypothetical protein XAC9322_920005 [Xanthomonas citri pv. citri]CEF35177.1 hypothetical protein XAC40_1530001 [Xanthomonas citri pv. citri]CEI33831.1 hypothetical protein XACJJ10_1090035 [Xanthomonas citri pv. citri]CEL35887.1 hypothetical protein XAC4311_2920008 [Xanthomonas citri pv. citri]
MSGGNTGSGFSIHTEAVHMPALSMFDGMQACKNRDSAMAYATRAAGCAALAVESGIRRMRRPNSRPPNLLFWHDLGSIK